MSETLEQRWPATAAVRASSPDAAHIAGASYRNLDYWVRTRASVGPSIAAAAGPGVRRVFGFGDLVALRTFVVLRGWGGQPTKRSEGMALEVIDRAAAAMREISDWDTGDCMAIDAAGKVWPGPSWPDSGEPYLVVPIEPIIDHVVAGCEMRLGVTL